MRKIVCFKKQESASYPGKFLIVPQYDKFHLDSTTGSFNVIMARLVGLSYAQYLRMCRDCFDAEIIGKNCLYPLAYFKDGEKLDMLIKNLNARANLILWDRAHPNYEEHKREVEEARNGTN